MIQWCSSVASASCWCGARAVRCGARRALRSTARSLSTRTTQQHRGEEPPPSQQHRTSHSTSLSRHTITSHHHWHHIIIDATSHRVNRVSRARVPMVLRVMKVCRECVLICMVCLLRCAALSSSSSGNTQDKARCSLSLSLQLYTLTAPLMSNTLFLFLLIKNIGKLVCFIESLLVVVMIMVIVTMTIVVFMLVMRIFHLSFISPNKQHKATLPGQYKNLYLRHFDHPLWRKILFLTFTHFQRVQIQFSSQI